MQIEALTFDFWNTLYKIPEEKERSFRRLNEMQALSGSFGQHRQADAIMRAIKETWEYTYWLQRREGYDIGPHGQVEQIVKRLEMTIDDAQFEEFYQMFIGYLLICPPEMNDGVREVLPVLAERYRLAVICNTRLHTRHASAGNHGKRRNRRFFQEKVFSDEVRWAKPNPLIFEHTLLLLGTAADAAAHIGDDPTTDLKGARAAGMTAVWLAPQAEDGQADCDYHIRHLRELLDIF